MRYYAVFRPVTPPNPLAERIAAEGAGVAAGILKGALRFTMRGEHSQKERWPVLPAWEKFLEGVTKARLVTEPKERTTEGSLNWLLKVAAVPLARVVLVLGRQVIDHILEAGFARLSPAEIEYCLEQEFLSSVIRPTGANTLTSRGQQDDLESIAA